MEENSEQAFYGSDDERKIKSVPASQPYVMDPDHRLLLRNTKPLLQSRNTAVSLKYFTLPSQNIFECFLKSGYIEVVSVLVSPSVYILINYDGTWSGHTFAHAIECLGYTSSASWVGTNVSDMLA